MVRKFPIVFYFLSFLACSVHAGLDLEVRTRSYFSAKEFKRIPEYFSGEEFSGNKIYLRSDPTKKSGYYFVVKVCGEAKTIPLSTTWEINWVSSIDPNEYTQRIPFSGSQLSNREIFIGLTGGAWTDSSAYPLAWQIRLLDPKDILLAESKSFLWSE